MRHLLLLCSVVFGLLSVSAQEQIETESIASDDVVDYGHKNEASNGVNVGRWLNWLTASVMRG